MYNGSDKQKKGEHYEKVVSLALSTLLVLSLAACGKADSSAAASSESKSSASSNSTSNSTQDYSPDGIKVGETYTTEDGKTYERVWNGTGSDLPTPSPEPKITYDNDFQAQTLVDNEECTIILQSVGYDDDYGYYWKLYFKNKTSDKKLGYSFGDCTLNGVGASLWLTSVEPGQEETEIHHWESSGLKIYNINPQDINTVSFYLDVYNELDYDVIPRHDFVDDDFVVYPKGEENATEPKHEIQPTDIVLFDNNACSMVICGFYSDSFMGYTAKAYYQNKTDDRIDIILDKGSINGFECTPEGAALLEPHSNAYVDIRWQEYAETYAENGNDPTSITEIVMPVFVRKDTGNNTVYIDATYSIDPQARTATPIVNPQ